MTRDLAALREAVENELDPTYRLVYIDRDDRLTDDQVAVLVRGDNPYESKAFDYLDEALADQRWMNAREVVDDLADAILSRWAREAADDDEDFDREELWHDWLDSGDRNDLRVSVEERDDSDVIRDLARNTPDVLLRVQVEGMGEDDGLSFTDVNVDDFLDRLGFEATERNLSLAAEIIANASPEFSVAMGQAIIAADVEDLYNLPVDGKVELRGVHLWLGSSFTGSGWCDGPFDGTVVVDRSELRTDKDAWGYSWTETAGPIVSAYKGEVVPVAEVTQ